MTRDEAITELYDNRNSRLTASDLDLFVALGMLKLDEPEPDMVRGLNGMSGKVRAFMRRFHLGEYSPSQLYSALDAAGLKIVEK